MQVNLQFDDDTFPMLGISERKGIFLLGTSDTDEANGALGISFIS